MNQEHRLEISYALRVKYLLNLGLENFEPRITDQLAHIRQQALAKHADTQTWVREENLAPIYLGNSSATSNSFLPQRQSWALSFIVLLALVVSLLSIDYWQEMRQINEVAEVDAMILSDDLPLNAHLDTGFVSALKAHD